MEELKERVCRANLDLVRHGLVLFTWGNVSGLDPERRLVVIKPSGVSYDKLTPADMVVLELDGHRVEGALSPSTDTPTHLELYRRFEGIGAVAHTHSSHATAWCQAGQSLPCFGTTHADYFYGPVPVTRYLTREEIAEDYEMNTGRVIVECFEGLDPRNMPAVLVASHAPFTWGDSPEKAVENMVVLEESARIALFTLALNGTAEAIARPLLDKHFLRKHGPGSYYGQKKDQNA
ncbi:L-ribulose-5-phosphate 4-epimerase [bacterium]|nr:L-ribulose-5-phosphate 4-epimerase [bacterium]